MPTKECILLLSAHIQYKLWSRNQFFNIFLGLMSKKPYRLEVPIIGTW